MKIIKKIILIMLILCATILVAPILIPESQLGFTVEAASIKINKSKYTMNKGEKYTLKITGTKKKVSWSSSNKKVATVNSKGKVTAKKKGTATITAKVGNKKYKCKITVDDPSINKTNISLEKGNTYTLKIKNVTRKISWSSSNKKVATVDSKGKVTAKKKGTATITAKVGNKKLKCKVKVEDYKLGISTTYTKLANDYILISIKNNNSVKLDSVSLDVKFYKNNVLVYTSKVLTVCLPAKATAYEKVFYPIDSNYDKMEYDKISISVTDTSIYEFLTYKNLSKNLTVTGNRTDSLYYGIVGEVKNIGDIEIDSAEVGVIYYKNNKIIFYDYEYISGLKSGSSKTIQFTRPYNSEYKDIDFDNYKLVINNAYSLY